MSSEVKAAEVHLSKDIGTLRYFMPIRKFALNFEIFTDVSYYRIISCPKIKRYKLRKKFVKGNTTQDNYWQALKKFLSASYVLLYKKDLWYLYESLFLIECDYHIRKSRKYYKNVYEQMIYRSNLRDHKKKFKIIRIKFHKDKDK